MHILAALLVAAVFGVLAFGTPRALMPLLIHFITAAGIAIVLVWLTTALLPYSLVIWLIAAAAIAAHREQVQSLPPSTQSMPAHTPASPLRLPAPAATAHH